MINRLFNRAVAYMASLCTDGGPSVTRWMYLRTGEVVTGGWFIMVLSLVWRYLRHGSTDGGLLGLVGGMVVPIFGFAAYNQSTKLTLDAKPAGDPSSVSTIGGTVTKGDTK